jgi:hypothetical protein
VLELTRTGFCFAVVASLAACETLLDIPDDPMLIGSQPWTCLGSLRESSPPKRDRVSVQVRACDFISSNCSKAANGLTAKLCAKSDVRCSSPIRADIRDSSGVLDFEVETGGTVGTGFDGFLAVSSQDDAYTSALLFFNPTIREALEEPMVLPLVPVSAVSTLVAASGSREPDPDHGFLFITALDCAGEPAESVAVAVDRPTDEVSVIYVDHGVFDRAARETDASGVAEVINVSPGSVHVTAHRAGAMPQRIGEVDVHVAARTISYASLVPSL